MEQTLDHWAVDNRPAWRWPDVGEDVTTGGPRYTDAGDRVVYAFKRDGSIYYVGRTAHLDKRMMAHRRAGMHIVADSCLLWTFDEDAAAARFETTLIAAFQAQANTSARHVSDPERAYWHLMADELDDTVNLLGCRGCGRLAVHYRGVPFRLEAGDTECACWKLDSWSGEQYADVSIGSRVSKALARFGGYDSTPYEMRMLDGLLDLFEKPSRA